MDYDTNDDKDQESRVGEHSCIRTRPSPAGLTPGTEQGYGDTDEEFRVASITIEEAPITSFGQRGTLGCPQWQAWGEIGIE